MPHSTTHSENTPGKVVPAGNLALAVAVGAPPEMLRHTSYFGNTRDRKIVHSKDGTKRTERHFPGVYAPSEKGLPGHILFSLKHEIPNLALLAAAFEKMPAKEIAGHVRSSPTGAYARRMGYLFELLTKKDLGPHLKDVRVGGNYVELLNSAKVVTSAPRRIPKWRVLDNLPGNGDYAPLIELTDEVRHAMRLDWKGEISRAMASGGGDSRLLRRALNYLYVKETVSSYQIERESIPENRATRFVEALKNAGQGSAENALSEASLAGLQGTIVETRFKETGFRKIQNYVGAMVRWNTVVHYVPPPPDFLKNLMAGLARAVQRIDGGTSPIIQAAVASFGFVFLHPFEDGNGRIHRYLLHDFLTRNAITPSGTALPVSAAILEDMRSYDSALEAYSKTVGRLVSFKMGDNGAMTVLNGNSVDWIWKFPDLTVQVEFLGRVLGKAIDMLADEISHLARYDALLKRARSIVDMPDRQLEDLLNQIHANNGKLSGNRRKQRFRKLAASEIREIEQAYAGIFSSPALPSIFPRPAGASGHPPGRN